ncbi:MAG: fibronectin type III domain-containing protein, partial [Ruminiclostridium sp.]|nr:fibronectin type III domain-containing protein [Ruminiclostridium sp.]
MKFLKSAALLSVGFIAAALCSLCAGAEDYTGADDAAVFDGAYLCSEETQVALSKTADQPNAVSGLSFSSRSDSSIILKWGTVSNADGYILEYLDGEKFTKLATFTADDEMTYGCYDLSPATLYKFRVRCYVNDNGNRVYSDYSKVLEVRTYPAVMTAMSQTDATVDSVTLQWYRNSTAKGYVIEKAVGDEWERVITIKDGNTTQYTVKGLDSGTTYQFRIKRYIYDGEQMLFGGYSSVTTANTAPLAPRGFSVSSKTNTSVSLKWNKQNADGFILDIYNGSTWTNKIITNGSAVSYKVTGLKSSTSYKFRINAYKGNINGDKNYPYCSGGYASLSVNTKPNNTTGLKAASSTETSITLNWNKNTSATGYIIERYNGSTWARVARISANSTVSYTVSSLTAGKEYNFRIK